MLLITIALATAAVSPLAFGDTAHFNKKVGATFCASPFELSDQVTSCEDNDLFVDEGEKCLDKLEAEEKAVSKFLPASFSANKDSKQASKFSSATQDYEQSSAALAYLIASVKLAEGEIQAYKFSLDLPSDIDEPEVTNGDEAAYAMSIDCYGTNRENLESQLEDMQTLEQKWTDIKKVADANAAAAGVSKGNLDASGSAGNLKRAKGTGKGSAAPQGKGQSGQSDITGVKQDQNKQQQK